MIKFFRKIRYNLMEQNKIGKYLKYAIGEIVLVVIGILIALQINNWNTHRLNEIKEEKILLEIKHNLNEDLQNIERILNENAIKIEAIDTSFYFMSKMNKKPSFAKELANQMSTLTNYDLFHPTRVAFDNMISSGSIDILLSDKLRNDISRYYSSNLLDGIQDQIIVTTQGFLNEAAPQMVNKTMMKTITNLDFDVRPLESITVYKDPNVISDLFVMRNKTREHNFILNTLETKIKALIASIDSYLDTK